MTGDDLLCIINQNRITEPKLLDAVCDLPDLLLRMRPGIVRVRPQLANTRKFDFHRNSSLLKCKFVSLRPCTEVGRHLNSDPPAQRRLPTVASSSIVIFHLRL